MKFGGKTDIGAKRRTNQDSYAVFSKSGYTCAVVCDGMGGAKGGNVASGLAVKTFSSAVKKAFSEKNPDDWGEFDIKRLLKSAIDEANLSIFSKATNDSDLEGMGTTLVAVIICLSGTYAVNIGDSRLYIQLDGEMKQISVDHSFVQYLIEKGEIQPDEAINHPNKNIILRALGISERVEADFFKIENYDRLLLCTDGLTNHVRDERIGEIISGEYTTKRPSYKARTEKLIAEANENGGADNITAVLLGIPD